MPTRRWWCSVPEARMVLAHVPVATAEVYGLIATIPAVTGLAVHHPSGLGCVSPVHAVELWHAATTDGDFLRHRPLRIVLRVSCSPSP